MIYIESPDVGHITLLTLRMGFSLPFFLIIALSRTRGDHHSRASITSKDWKYILILGVGGYYLSSVFDFWGLEYITASLERLILFIYPTIVVFISFIIYKRKVTNVMISALALAYIGILTVMFDEDISRNSQTAIGSILILMAAITYASYLVGSEHMIKKLGNARYTSIVMSVASICVILHFFAINSFEDIFHISSSTLYKSLAMSVFCTVIPAFLVSEGIRKIGSSHAAIIASIGPVSTIFLAHYFLEERISSIQIIGTILVLGGVILISTSSRQDQT